MDEKEKFEAALFEVLPREQVWELGVGFIGAWIVEPDGNYRPVKGRSDA